MKAIDYLITCITLLLLLSIPSKEANGQVPEKLKVKVLTYNIYGGRNTDGTRNLDRIADVIRTLDPDVVAIQEVDRHTGRLNGLDLAGELGRRLDMIHIFSRAMKYDGGEYGEAILSRLPVTFVTRHNLPTVSVNPADVGGQEVEPRVAVAARITFPGTDRKFVLIGTHLDHLRDPANRNIQAAELRYLSEEYERYPTVLAGDLNSLPDSEAIATISRNWSDTWPSTGPQGTNRSKSRRIDYIFTDSKSTWRVVKTYRGTDFRKNDKEWQALLELASDHQPVMAELELVK